MVTPFMKLLSHLAIFAGATALVHSLSYDSLSLEKAMDAHHHRTAALVAQTPKKVCKSNMLLPYISHHECQSNRELFKVPVIDLFSTV